MNSLAKFQLLSAKEAKGHEMINLLINAVVVSHSRARKA